MSKRTSSDHGGEVSEEVAPRELTLKSGFATAGAFTAYFCTTGVVNAFGVFQQYYLTDLLRTKTDFQISWIGSMTTFCFFGFAAPAGILSDKFGSTIPVIGGSVFLVFSVFMLSLCDQYYQVFLSQGVLFGASMAFIAIPATRTVPHFFHRNRGLATGISIAGSSVGGIFWPAVLNRLFNADKLSFGWSLRIVGSIILPLVAFCVVTIRIPPSSPAKAPSDGPVDAQPSREKDNSKPNKDYSAIRSPAFVFLGLGLAIAYFGFFTPFFFISRYAAHLGFSDDLSFYLVSILNGASIFGRILPGAMSDHWGYFNILSISTLLSGVILFCWTTATSIGGVVVWAVAYGFVSGAILSSQLACAISIATPETRGAAIGLILASVSLTGLFGTPIAGKLVQRGYLAVSAYSGATLLVGACVIFVARLCREKRLKTVV